MGKNLFQAGPENAHIEVFLGEFTCDIPFGGGNTEQVEVSLVNDSKRSRNGIPVLRLIGTGYQMDFTADEQTPAGHAGKVVADWLNAHKVDEPTRFAAELFLWQWPGIDQLEDGSWRLADRDERRRKFEGRMVDYHGETITEEAARDLPVEEILERANLQVRPYGYCRKPGPCYLLDACPLCPWFATNRHYLPALQERIPDLHNRREDAVESNHTRLAETIDEMLKNIDRIANTLTDRVSAGGEEHRKE